MSGVPPRTDVPPKTGMSGVPPMTGTPAAQPKRGSPSMTGMLGVPPKTSAQPKPGVPPKTPCSTEQKAGCSPLRQHGVRVQPLLVDTNTHTKLQGCSPGAPESTLPCTPPAPLSPGSPAENTGATYSIHTRFV